MPWKVNRPIPCVPGREWFPSSILCDPFDDLPRDLIGRNVLHYARIALLFRQLDFEEREALIVDLGGLGFLQRRHNAAHVHHPDLRIVARLAEMSCRPAE